MSIKRVVAVFGATGAQGGSVVRALQKDGSFEIRAITRDVNSAKAKALGVTLVKGDQNDPDSLIPALTGADAVFSLTNWDPPSSEYELGKRVAEAAKKAGVKQFVWSTLPNAKEESNGKYELAHLTDKSKVNKIVEEAGFEHYTFVMPGFYFQNFLSTLSPRKGEDGVYHFYMPGKPTTVLSGVDIEDMGAVVLQVLKHPSKYHTKYIKVCGEELTQEQVVKVFEKVTEKKALLTNGPFQGFPIANELNDMFYWFDEYGLYGKTVAIPGTQVYPDISNFEQFVKNKLFPILQ